MIDGATNATITVATGANPIAVAVNPVTNKVYVANNGSANVTVIDGATNATTTVAAGTDPYAVAVNPVTNKVYVANYGSASVTVIDGATNATTTVAAGTNPQAVAVNPVTNKAYVANNGSDNVTVIDEQSPRDIPLRVAIAPLAGNATTSPTPSFALTASTSFTPNAPAVQGVRFQVDTWQGPWQAGHQHRRERLQRHHRAVAARRPHPLRLRGRRRGGHLDQYRLGEQPPHRQHRRLRVRGHTATPSPCGRRLRR